MMMITRTFCLPYAMSLLSNSFIPSKLIQSRLKNVQSFNTRSSIPSSRLLLSMANDEGDCDDELEIRPSLELYNSLVESLDSSLKSYTRKSSGLQTELIKSQQSEELARRANLITSNLYQIDSKSASVTVQDWENGGVEIELVLNPDKYNSPNEEAEALYAKARKMRRGSSVVKDLLTKNDRLVTFLDSKKSDLLEATETFTEPEQEQKCMDLLQFLSQQIETECSNKSIKISFENSPNNNNNNNNNGSPKQISSKLQPNKKKSQSSKHQQSQQSFREFTSPDGHKIIVGRNRRHNEQISFQLGKQRDLWMHARGRPGAHVLFKIQKNDPQPTEASFQFAANLAAFYSDARTERKAVITVAEPKHVLKPRGAPLGAVKIRKELRSLIGRPMDVPEDLKRKREESGEGNTWDEMGNDKAKNKKRTLGREKDMKKKKKEEKRLKKKGDGRTDDDAKPKIDFFAAI